MLIHRVLLISLLCTLGCSSQSQPTGTEQERAESAAVPAVSQKIPSESYEEILYELGAFPVSKLTKRYWNNGHPGEVFSKGKREDVHGWLPPFWVRTDSYLTQSEKTHFGIPKAPLSYERYISFLDVETYQQTEDPLLFAIIQFTLDELHRRKIKIKNPEDLLKVYHAKMGLDNKVLWLLKRRELIDGPMIAVLYRQYQDPLLFRFLVPPEQGQDDYKAFLEELLVNPKLDTMQSFAVFTQLYQVDKPTHLAGYKNFIFKNVAQVPDWLDRSQMYAALIGIGDRESVNAVNHALLNDPTAQVREFLLRELKRQDQVVKYIDTIHLLSQRKGQKCVREIVPNGPGFHPDENILADSLKTYLNWAKEKQNLSPKAKQKILASLQAISNDASNSFEPRSYKPGEDRFEANKPSQGQ
ncbi:hypothetical protein Pan241w_58500 [Gimesia alba]|uniref:HEAT repeat domain-containing protein n=1 Tax=Gimesia alba TaxID=2527973 RepID=A0A517RPH2_9PLAN|nr:hypothetical protein [Gimesia alba]QDT45722.1 hypothetical protein Pan241w_58500 [Gimesia alba]